PSHDIYYIVLDGLSRPDVLRDVYGLDETALVEDLRSRGFFVADRARSNYAHTFFSFASLMNLDYLTAVTDVIGRDSENREPLGFLIKHNALMRLAREAGYRVIRIDADWVTTGRFNEADECSCGHRGLNSFSLFAIRTTPLGAFVPDRWTYSAHRESVLNSF